jgi:hypothetical protein
MPAALVSQLAQPDDLDAMEIIKFRVLSLTFEEHQ